MRKYTQREIKNFVLLGLRSGQIYAITARNSNLFMIF